MALCDPTLSGMHLEGDGRQVGGLDQVAELSAHDLDAADLPAQRGLVDEGHEVERILRVPQPPLTESGEREQSLAISRSSRSMPSANSACM